MIWVQLPTPPWLEQVNEQENILRKFGSQLNPAVRDMIRREQEQLRMQSYRPVAAGAGAPETQPAEATTQASAPAATQPVGAGELMFPGRLLPDPGKLVWVATGLLIDDDGHAIVPAIIDRQKLADPTLRVLVGPGRVTTARFVGSDAKTNLSVVQLDDHSEQKPVKFAPRRPSNGALVLVVDREGLAHLSVWNNLRPEAGVIALPDGAVAGFGFNGQFLTAAACRPIVDQLISSGKVRRALLGVAVTRVPGIAGDPALRIQTVDPDSAAQRGGLRAGDLILSLAGEPVGDGPTFAAVIATSQGPTNFKVMRGTQTIDIDIDLQPQP
jgi:S1-C subfamily serine protease